MLFVELRVFALLHIPWCRVGMPSGLTVPHPWLCSGLFVLVAVGEPMRCGSFSEWLWWTLGIVALSEVAGVVPSCIAGRLVSALRPTPPLAVGVVGIPLGWSFLPVEVLGLRDIDRDYLLSVSDVSPGHSSLPLPFVVTLFGGVQFVVWYRWFYFFVPSLLFSCGAIDFPQWVALSVVGVVMFLRGVVRGCL